MRGLSPVEASGGHSSSRCAGLSLSRPLLLRSTGSRRAGSAVVADGPSRSAACGIFPEQGSNPCPLHWQADPQPLRHQGSPHTFIHLREGHFTRCFQNLEWLCFNLETAPWHLSSCPDSHDAFTIPPKVVCSLPLPTPRKQKDFCEHFLLLNLNKPQLSPWRLPSARVIRMK